MQSCIFPIQITTSIQRFVFINFGSVTLFLTYASQAPRHWIVRVTSAIAVTVASIWLLFASHHTGREMLAVHDIPKSPSILDHIASSNVTCQRRPLASTSYFPGKRTYHAFDDVLLVVFFSHARYDVNLDYYRDVYSEFFPNVRALVISCTVPKNELVELDCLRRPRKQRGRRLRAFIRRPGRHLRGRRRPLGPIVLQNGRTGTS